VADIHINMGVKQTILGRNRGNRIGVPDTLVGYGFSSGGMQYTLSSLGGTNSFDNQGRPLITPAGRPIVWPSVGINWNDLVWDAPFTNVGGSGGPNVFTAAGHLFTLQEFGGGAGGAADFSQEGNLTYTGPLTNCNLHVDWTVVNPANVTQCFVLVDDVTNAVNILAVHLTHLDANGPYDFPFVIPLSVAINYKVSQSGQINAFNPAGRQFTSNKTLTPFA